MNLYIISSAGIFILILASILVYAAYKKKSIPVNLYFEALRKENMGEFEVAERVYQSALEQVGKYRFHEDLKLKIEEKIRLMHTLMEYERNISFSSFNHPVTAE
jgi:hypothetical protein